MKKIPTIFKRNPERMNEVIPEQNPACEWVFYGEGVATRKYDGTCCRIKDGQLWKRRELKQGARQHEGFEIADFDEVTGKTVGWMPVTDCKEDIWHICDILANGALLPDPRGLRYGRLDPQWPLATEASPPQPSANAISLKHRPDRFACFHCRQFRHNGRFMICWCDWDRHEFPALCDEYAPKHGH